MKSIGFLIVRNCSFEIAFISCWTLNFVSNLFNYFLWIVDCLIFLTLICLLTFAIFVLLHLFPLIYPLTTWFVSLVLLHFLDLWLVTLDCYWPVKSPVWCGRMGKPLHFFQSRHNFTLFVCVYIVVFCQLVWLDFNFGFY